jgi:hypothetical protein
MCEAQARVGIMGEVLCGRHIEEMYAVPLPMASFEHAYPSNDAARALWNRVRDLALEVPCQVEVADSVDLGPNDHEALVFALRVPETEEAFLLALDLMGICPYLRVAFAPGAEWVAIKMLLCTEGPSPKGKKTIHTLTALYHLARGVEKDKDRRIIELAGRDPLGSGGGQGERDLVFEFGSRDEMIEARDRILKAGLGVWTTEK